jgi:hypothetical protein
MNDESTYFEKSKLPIIIWFLFALMCLSIYLAIWAPLGVNAALVAALLSGAGLMVISRNMQTTIIIKKKVLYANRAKIDLKFIKSVTPLGKAEFKNLNGAAADPAAFLATNFWTNTGVKVEIKDKNDPTPYWLISSKRAEELAKKLT